MKMINGNIKGMKLLSWNKYKAKLISSRDTIKMTINHEKPHIMTARSPDRSGPGLSDRWIYFAYGWSICEREDC